MPVISALWRWIWGWGGGGRSGVQGHPGILETLSQKRKKKVQEKKKLLEDIVMKRSILSLAIRLWRRTQHNSPKEETERRTAANSTEEKTIRKGSKQNAPLKTKSKALPAFGKFCGCRFSFSFLFLKQSF